MQRTLSPVNHLAVTLWTMTILTDADTVSGTMCSHCVTKDDIMSMDDPTHCCIASGEERAPVLCAGSDYCSGTM